MGIKVKCSNCGREHDVQLECEEVDREERKMGAEVTYECTGTVECPCGQLIEVKRNEWEYPEGSPPNWDSTDVTGGEEVPGRKRV